MMMDLKTFTLTEVMNAQAETLKAIGSRRELDYGQTQYAADVLMKFRERLMRPKPPGNCPGCRVNTDEILRREKVIGERNETIAELQGLYEKARAQVAKDAMEANQMRVRTEAAEAKLAKAREALANVVGASADSEARQFAKWGLADSDAPAEPKPEKCEHRWASDPRMSGRHCDKCGVPFTPAQSDEGRGEEKYCTACTSHGGHANWCNEPEIERLRAELEKTRGERDEAQALLRRVVGMETAIVGLQQGMLLSDIRTHLAAVPK